MMPSQATTTERRTARIAPPIVLCALLTGLCAATAQAGEGRLLGVSGLASLEGAGGGGMTAWALLAGHAEAGERSLGANLSYVGTGEFDVLAGSVNAVWNNRWELSLSSQQLNLDTLVEQGVSNQADLRLDTLGLKLRLGGDPVYGRLGQLSAGMQFKRNADFELARLAGAERDHGIDAYLAWTRAWIDGPFHRSWVLSATLRASQAHQTGFLGFDNDYRYNGEGAIAMFLNERWLIGAEYRNKPDRLAFAAEDDWADAFLLWLPSKRWQMAVAYVDLGDIGGVADQRGWYLTVQFND